MTRSCVTDFFWRGRGTHYFEDTKIGRQQSLETKDKYHARTVVYTTNEALCRLMIKSIDGLCL
jgi:hypothetical protein